MAAKLTRPKTPPPSSDTFNLREEVAVVSKCPLPFDPKTFLATADEGRSVKKYSKLKSDAFRS
jgi:hypothetical protein